MENQTTPPAPPSRLAAYADLFERLWDMAFLVDTKTYQILEYNPSSERVLGEGAETFVGKNFLELVKEPLREEFEKGLRVASRRYSPRRFKSELVLSVPMFVEVTAGPLDLSNSEKVLQVIVRDITQQVEVEKKRDELMGELQVANGKLSMMTKVDEMTGLFNFRHFKDQLGVEHSRSIRYGSNYAIIFFDLDNFKHYNDRNGHPAGDALLRRLAGILQSKCRASDLPARYGGEEFAILCPEVDWRGASELAERIRVAIETTDFDFASFQPLGKVSVSIGVSSFPEDGQTYEEVLKASDEAMYYAKKNGKNRVVSKDIVRNLAKQ
ncbi:sensor domain-containing diguanylate cyclase [Bdellovibrionota bacterium FG-2]